jgi:putative membrane protein
MPMSEPKPGEGTVLPEATRLALERTRLAYERTLLAWIRTATTLIAFGFTLYKFFQFERAKETGDQAQHLLGPRYFAIVMIGIGLVALLLATIDHTRSVRLLRAQYGRVPGSLTAALAALISVLGILGLLAAIFRQ